LANIFALAESCHAIEITKCSIAATDNTALIANLICSGKFIAAKELLATEKKSNVAGIAYLVNIVSEYEVIEKKRQIVCANAYQEQIDKLEKFYLKTNIEEANGITDVLQVILETNEYANNKQRQVLFENVFVKQTIEKAIIKAGELDANGEWLDAYKRYYYWLEKIDPDNLLYSDRARQLIDKATIKASLEDSPCETCAERYVGVDRQIFLDAINILDTSYVVRIVDYRQMAIKAIKRCGMLAEVIAKSNPGISKNKNELSSEDKKGFEKWSTALMAIMDEINRSPGVMSKKEFVDIFEEVLALNATSVKLPQQVLIAQFTGGALSALDPYTVVVWPNQVSDFEKQLNGKFSGVGITFLKEKGLWVVSSLLLNTPAYKSGLNVGDVIEAVDGVETKEMSSDCMSKKIAGPSCTKVTLTVKHPDENKTSDITMTRASVTIPSIHGWQITREGEWRYMIDNHNQIGYIRIASFNETTATNLEKVLIQLEANGLRGLVLDLRSNPGGVVNGAAEIVDKFIEKGMIVSTRPRYGMATYIAAHKDKTHPDYPIVVLIDKTSASASEIVAGALQDQKYKRATLVGERTFGKGSVQNIKRLPGNARLKYTMAYYHLPSGQKVEGVEATKGTSIENWGVMPDVEVKLNAEELKKLLDVQKANKVLTNDSNNHVSNNIKYSSQETISADPQLAIGLLILKGKMVLSLVKPNAMKSSQDYMSGQITGDEPDYQ
jgi:carboxyl-terminal processing protease